LCFIIEQTDHTLKGQKGGGAGKKGKFWIAWTSSAGKKLARQELTEHNVQIKSVRMNTLFWGKYHFGSNCENYIKRGHVFSCLSNILLDKNHKRFGNFLVSRAIFSI